MDDLASRHQSGHGVLGRGAVRRRAPHVRPPAQRPAGHPRGLPQPDRRPQQGRFAHLPQGRGDRLQRPAGRAACRATSGCANSRTNPPGSTVVLAVSRQAGSNAVEVAKSRQKPAAAAARGPAGVDPAAAGVRPLADHRRFGGRRADDALHRVRARRAGDLRLPGPRGGHADPRRGAAAVAAADLRGHVPARLQRQQPDAHGADARHRVPRGRRRGVPGKRRAPRRGGRDDPPGVDQQRGRNLASPSCR